MSAKHFFLTRQVTIMRTDRRVVRRRGHIICASNATRDRTIYSNSVNHVFGDTDQLALLSRFNKCR